MSVQLDKQFGIYLQKRPLSSYPQKVLDELKLIAISHYIPTIKDPSSKFKEDFAQPFGSFTYRFQRFPGDIDGMEEVGLCCDEKDASEQYVKVIQKIVSDILDKRSHYYSEIKAGINPIFDFSVGDLVNGTYHINPMLKRITQQYFKDGFISPEESTILLHIYANIDKQPVENSNYYDIVEGIFRKYRVLRWKPEEILNGKKKLENGKNIFLVDAIQMNTMTKIDEVAFINGSFVEITNNWHLAWVDNEGGYHIFNKNAGKPENLLDEIEKLYFSNTFYSPFKMIKRIYSYSRYMYINTHQDKWKRYIDLLIPLLTGDVSAAYQIKSELDTLVLVLKLYKSPSPQTINNQLDNTKLRIASVLPFNMDSLNDMNKHLNNAIDSPNSTMKIEQIEKVIKKLKHFINWATIKYTQKIGLNPPSRDLLPSKLKYEHIIRTPESAPINPLELTKLKPTENFGLGCDTCGGCETCGGSLKYDECLTCRDNPYVQLSKIINRMYH